LPILQKKQINATYQGLTLQKPKGKPKPGQAETVEPIEPKKRKAKGLIR